MTVVVPGTLLASTLSGVGIALLDLDLTQDDLGRSRSLLAPDEIDRASRFRFDRDRNRYIAGRGQLRQTLGTVLGMSPRHVPLLYGPWGKPELPAAVGVAFNLAHSEAAALLAVGDAGLLSIGVDIERLRTDIDTTDVACRHFAPGEVARYLALPDDGSRVAAFYRCWTRKEAVLKAMGAGLSVDLNAFEVTFGDPAAPAMLIWSAPGFDPPADTQLIDLTPAIAGPLPGYVAALAAVAPSRPNPL